MMAAVRILIWLRVKLVRRSRISNMAFSPWRIFVSGGRRACMPPVRQCYDGEAADERGGGFVEERMRGVRRGLRSGGPRGHIVHRRRDRGRLPAIQLGEPVE